MSNYSLEAEKGFFHPICNTDEIERVFKTETARDYLLKLRAETVVDDMKLFRVVRNRYLLNKEKWNFTDHFSTLEFDSYIDKLPDELKNKADLTAGFVFSNNPNGSLMRTDYGDIIIVSEALRYFLFYMNLCYLDFGVEIPPSVRAASRMIAIRTMLKTETLDFEQDPRGIIPPEINTANNNYVQNQLEFIIGHEYAHHFCNHLDSKYVVERSLYRPLMQEPEKRTEKFYSHNQKQEFEADIFALEAMKISKELKSHYIHCAILFFAYLDVYQTVSDYIFPPGNNYNTHPDPLDRLWHIYDHFEDQIVDLGKNDLDDMLEGMSYDKDWLIDHVGYNIEWYEMYGSIYLAEPNTKWRGKELIDRVDYY